MCFHRLRSPFRAASRSAHRSDALSAHSGQPAMGLPDGTRVLSPPLSLWPPQISLALVLLHQSALYGSPSSAWAENKRVGMAAPTEARSVRVRGQRVPRHVPRRAGALLDAPPSASAGRVGGRERTGAHTRAGPPRQQPDQ